MRLDRDDADELLNALPCLQWKRQRREAIDGEGFFCLGATAGPAGSYVAWPTTDAEAKAVKLANDVLFRSAGAKDAKWCGLQLNRNTVARPHKDKGNVGISFCVRLGGIPGRVPQGAGREHLDRGWGAWSCRLG